MIKAILEFGFCPSSIFQAQKSLVVVTRMWIVDAPITMSKISDNIGKIQRYDASKRVRRRLVLNITHKSMIILLNLRRIVVASGYKVCKDIT